MKQKYRLVAQTGLNARVASLLVGVFNRFASNKVVVYHNDDEADGKSILSLITLVIKSGEEIEVEVEGNNPEEVYSMLEKTSDSSLAPIVEKL